MPDENTKLDSFEIRDLEDNFHYRVLVEHCASLGNYGKPGLRITYTVPGGTYFCVFEPYTAEKLHYEAKKSGENPFLHKRSSWLHYDNAWVKNYLVWGGDTLKARVEVKVKSADQPEAREYDLPFKF
jgi:hypothetical protein